MLKIMPLLFAIAFTVAGLSGCGTKPTVVSDPVITTVTPVAVVNPVAVAAIDAATPYAIDFALGELAKTNPALAATAAVQISTIIHDEILPYLAGSQNIATAAINAFIQSKLTALLPLNIQNAINLAASVFSPYIPSPSPNTFLSAPALTYMTDFLIGVCDGAQNFSSPVAAKRIFAKGEQQTEKSAWFKPAA